MTDIAKQVTIDLALQGGGSHGAFTWGVLDRLLEEERIRIAGVSGASAGAMNAVVLAAGMLNSGRDGAREALRRFWTKIGDAARINPLQHGPLAVFFGVWGLKDLAINNFPICPTSGGPAATLSLTCVVPLHGASGRLAAHPARLVQIGKLLIARS